MPKHDPSLRRANLRMQFDLFSAEDCPINGAKGVHLRFAQRLQMHPSTLSRYLADPDGDSQGKPRATRDISDAIARQICNRLHLSEGWLDATHYLALPPSPAEQAALADYLAALRASNAPGRRQLRRLVKLVLEGKDLPDIE